MIGASTWPGGGRQCWLGLPARAKADRDNLTLPPRQSERAQFKRAKNSSTTLLNSAGYSIIVNRRAPLIHT